MEATFTENLRKFFESKGITQKSIADELNVAPAYINKPLTGKKAFGKKTAQRFQDLYGLSSSWLLTGEGSMLTEPATAPAASSSTDLSSTDLSSALNKAMDEIAAQRRLTEKSQQQIDRLLSLLEADRHTSTASSNDATPEEDTEAPRKRA